jgi:soluble lytic murein transglycosylase-like protein
MKIFSRLIVLLIFIFGFTLFLGWYAETSRIEAQIEVIGEVSKDMPPSMQLYHYIKKYSKEYDVPLNIAFGVAHHETGYEGPFHWRYNPKLTSIANAYGAMQIQVPTANSFSDGKVTKTDLLNNLELNVDLSMRILSYLKKKYGNWKLALGAYNTGRPVVNQYAVNISNFQPQNLKYILND